MSRSTRTFSIVLGVCILLAVVGAGIFFTMPRSQAVYTDADTIYASKSIAKIRDVLWQPPELLSQGLTTEGDEYEPAMSPDGLTLVFVRGRPGEGADLYQSVRTPEGWTTPEPLGSINTDADELGPAFTPAGDGLYFYSDRPGTLGGYDIWFAQRTDSGWGEPTVLGSTINSVYNDYGPAIAPDGKTFYFASNRPRVAVRSDDAESGRWPATVRESFPNLPYDIYSAEITDRGMGEASLVEALSSAFSDGAPEVSPAQDFVYFASNRPGGEGGFDLYRARLVDGKFFPVEHLGDGVNTAYNELDPALGMGGFGLAFSSDRPSFESLERDYDLYKTHSREVYRDAQPLAARMSLVDFLNVVVPWLLLLLLLLGLLTLLRLITTDERWKARWRRLGLLAKCIVLSGLLHMLLLALLTLWHVTNDLEGLFNTPGGSKVTLVSSSVGGGAISQIRGEIASSVSSESLDVRASKAVMELASPPAFEAAMSRALPEPVVRDDAPSERVTVASSAPVRSVNEASQKPLSEEATELDVTLPTTGRREAVVERAVDPSAADVRAEPAPSRVALELSTSESVQPRGPELTEMNVASSDLTPMVPIEVSLPGATSRRELAELAPIELAANDVVAGGVDLPSLETARETTQESPLEASLSVMSPSTPAESEARTLGGSTRTPELDDPTLDVADDSAFDEATLARSEASRVYDNAALELTEVSIEATEFAMPERVLETVEPVTEIEVSPTDMASELQSERAAVEIGGSSRMAIETDSLDIDELALRDETREELNTFERTDPLNRPDTDDPVLGALAFDLSLPSVVEVPEQVAIERHFTGIVRNDLSNEPLPGVRVRIDSDQGDLVEVLTDPQGTFVLRPDFESDFVAVTASREGYLPHAMNLPIADLERGVVREIRLKPIEDTIIAIEDEPLVHHLGDNAFGGSINSQFQKESEGLEFSANFRLTTDQVAILGDVAAVTLLAKGLQADNRIYINDERIREDMDSSPRDGSFGTFTALFDAGWLVEGENEITIESRRSSGSDHDDFEFVNIQILLTPPVEENAPRRRRSSQTL